LTGAAQLTGQGGAAEHAPLLLIEGHDPHRLLGRGLRPAFGQQEQGGDAAAVVVCAD